MTAEERLAYFQGEKRRDTLQPTKKQEKNSKIIFLKIKLFLAVILFILFLSMDYTGCKIKGIGSHEIVILVTSHMDFPENIKLPQFP